MKDTKRDLVKLTKIYKYKSVMVYYSLILRI